jgi:hypothetical protein
VEKFGEAEGGLIVHISKLTRDEKMGFVGQLFKGKAYGDLSQFLGTMKHNIVG